MSTGQPGTSPNPSSGLSDKDQWLQDALGVKMASFGSSAVDARHGPQGPQAKPQANQSARAADGRANRLTTVPTTVTTTAPTTFNQR